mgnify:CR=1 FL=1
MNSAQRMFAPHIAADPNLSVYIARTVYDLTDSAQRIALAVALGKSNAAVCEGQK